jgi:hypothetical protein
MAENEITALIAQIRKLVKLIDQPAPLSEEQQLEFKTTEAMIRGLFAHRGPGYETTKEQALELATVMQEMRNVRQARGVEEAPFEEVLALAESLMSAPKPAKN